MRIIAIAFITGIAAAMILGIVQYRPIEPPRTTPDPEIMRSRQEAIAELSGESDSLKAIESAQTNIEKDLAHFRRSGATIAEARGQATQELEKSRSFLSSALDLGRRCQTAFQRAEPSASYPVVVHGEPLDREELIEQTRLALNQQKSLGEIVPEYERIVNDLSREEARIQEHIRSASAIIDDLEAEKRRVRAAVSESDGQQVLLQVRTLLTSSPAATGTDEAVPTFDDMMRTASFSGADGDEELADVLSFLRGAAAGEAPKR